MTSTASSEILVSFNATRNFAVHVSDLTRAKDFYGNKFGFRLIEESAVKLVFDAGAFTLYVNLDDHPIPFIPALEVKNYERAKEYLIENGCEVVHEWKRSKALYFKDPFGITFDIVEKE